METIFRMDSLEEFQKAADEIVHNFYGSNTVTQDLHSSSLIDLKKAKEDLKKLLQESQFDINKVTELLVQNGWEERKITYISKLLNEKKTELLYAFLNNYNSEYGETITNFDYVLKLVLGTSELNTLRYPLLQLILSTESNDNQRKFTYDVNKDTLLKLINTLEKLDDM